MADYYSSYSRVNSPTRRPTVYSAPSTYRRPLSPPRNRSPPRSSYSRRPVTQPAAGSFLPDAGQTFTDLTNNLNHVGNAFPSFTETVSDWFAGISKALSPKRQLPPPSRY